MLHSLKLLFECVLMEIIWLDVYDFVKFYVFKQDIFVVVLVKDPVIILAGEKFKKRFFRFLKVGSYYFALHKLPLSNV